MKRAHAASSCRTDCKFAFCDVRDATCQVDTYDWIECGK